MTAAATTGRPTVTPDDRRDRDSGVLDAGTAARGPDGRAQQSTAHLGDRVLISAPASGGDDHRTAGDECRWRRPGHVLTDDLSALLVKQTEPGWVEALVLSLGYDSETDNEVAYTAGLSQVLRALTDRGVCFVGGSRCGAERRSPRRHWPGNTWKRWSTRAPGPTMRRVGGCWRRYRTSGRLPQAPGGHRE